MYTYMLTYMSIYDAYMYIYFTYMSHICAFRMGWYSGTRLTYPGGMKG